MNQSQNFAGQHLKLATHAYILQELGSAIDDKIFDDPKTNEIEKIQKILDNSDYQLRMYGSAEELGQNLKIYRNFPESYQFFGTHYEPSDNTVTVYKSLKGEKYVYKNDLFVLLQQFAFENFLESFPGSNTEDLRFKIVSALRITENKLLKKIEFVKHNPKVFDENYAEAVYSEIEKNKKGDVLRTCDLFDAIEQCLLICVLENYPKFKKFVHNQKGCHRVIGLNCDSCRTTVKKDQKIEAPRSKILPEKDQKIEAPRSKILPEKDQKIADASQFLEIPDNALTPMGLHKEAMYYIIDEIRPNLDKIKYPKIISGNEKELFLSMMKVSNQKLEMYGSAEELLENVKIYRSFPKIHKFFLTDLEPFQTTPTIYRNLNDKPYICKHDLFVILQNLVAKIFKNSDLEFLTIVAYHLKQQAEKLGDSMEFVPLDTNVLKDIQEELRIDMSRRLKAHNHRKLKIEMSQLSYPKIIEIFKKITPIDWDPNRHDRIETLIKHYGRTAKNERARIEELSTLYTATRITVECLQNVIEKHPELFLPDRKTVRLFEDGDEQFVMRSEVLDILRTKGTPEHIFLSTMKLADISGKNIEFIRYPIHRAKHCAVPIPGPSGFYVLAVDSLLETLKMMIFGLKLFQKRGNWDVDRWRIQLMDAMGPMFNTVYKKEEKDPYFFHHEIVNVCRQQFLECFGNTLNLPTADIRSVKPQGFTLEDLKIELTHLGLTDMFPDILYHTGRVYSEIEKNKKGRCLRTCDLYYAIENCQLICIFNRIINLKIFLHNQKGCKRVLGLECEYCDKDEQ
ncbi:hypothetical protein L5515_013207 [Caenorhabditis briggsae]|uniref:DUF7809 domain-containing protein n=1 Tax=Caenorhabditis briggsae TaxID=6238 RepID=A0AAE9E822_CAEBR|nr:hypothetical protein L5515_013207 [Caenorhabditis briggsae]